MSGFHAVASLSAVVALLIAEPRAAAQTGHTIDIDGFDVHVVTAGWEHAAPGMPTVVFEGGSTLPAELWAPVIALVAQNAPVVAFDPAGLGESEWDGAQPTPEHMNDKLHRLLRAIDAPPPYILVGHSWASWLVRAYSGRYPDEVVGLVLIDPTPPVAEFLAAFEEIGLGEAGLDELNDMMQRMTASWPPGHAQYSVVASYGARRSDPEVPPTPSVPVAVLVAGGYTDAAVPDSLRPSFDLDAFFEALRPRQNVSPTEWVRASPNGTLVFASESTHCIQCDDPALVAWAIRRVLDAAVPEELRLPDRPVAVVRTSSLQAEGEQAYVDLYADGTASGLIVVNFADGQLYGTSIPDSWSWLDANTVEICGNTNTLRNDAGFSPPERDCGTFLITGKELDEDGDGDIDLIETFSILNPSFYANRPDK